MTFSNHRNVNWQTFIMLITIANTDTIATKNKYKLYFFFIT